jgi:hypothetical protein
LGVAVVRLARITGVFRSFEERGDGLSEIGIDAEVRRWSTVIETGIGGVQSLQGHGGQVAPIDDAGDHSVFDKGIGQSGARRQWAVFDLDLGSHGVTGREDGHDHLPVGGDFGLDLDGAILGIENDAPGVGDLSTLPGGGVEFDFNAV